MLLLRRADEHIGLARAVAKVFADRRRSASVTHAAGDLFRQRLYALCCCWEDVTDHNTLRHDLALHTAVGHDGVLASGPTLCHLAATCTPAHTAALHGVLLDQSIASRAETSQELIVDIDATHIPLHGEQEKAHFHRYYDNYCYLPLYVFCGQDLLACVRRPSSRDPASILSALIKLLAQRLRQKWPQVRLIVRGDSGFYRPAALRRFDKGASITSLDCKKTQRC